MATKYVRKTGNDSTGDGSTATPWLTVNKGITAMADGDTLVVGTGTYVEGSGMWSVPARAGHAIVQSESGVAADVIIQGAGTTGNNILFHAAWTYDIEFKNLTLSESVNTKDYNVEMSHTGTVRLTNCVVTIMPASTAKRCLWIAPMNSGSMVVVLTNCTVNSTAATATTDKCDGIFAEPSNGYNALQSLTITNTNVSVYGSPVHIFPVTVGDISNVTISGGTWTVLDPLGNYVASTAPAYLRNITHLSITNVLAYGSVYGSSILGCPDFALSGGTYSSRAGNALVIGSDSVFAGTTAGTVTNPTILTGSAHGFEIGYSCDGVACTGLLVKPGLATDWAVVIKMCQNCSITASTIYGGATNNAMNSSVYFKGAQNCSVTNNMISASVSPVISAGVGDSSQQCSGLTITGNTILTSGSAPAYNIATLTGSNTIDDNFFVLNPAGGTPNYGTIGSTTNIATLAALRTAWATYNAAYAAYDAGSLDYWGPSPSDIADAVWEYAGSEGRTLS